MSVKLTMISSKAKGFTIALFVVASLFLSASFSYAQTQLVFRTPAGAQTIAANQTVTLGTADVASYRQIRVVMGERVDSRGPITILLTITEGNELVAQLDTITLQPRQSLTRVYDVPGTKITIVAKAAQGNGAVDVLMYGNR